MRSQIAHACLAAAAALAAGGACQKRPPAVAAAARESVADVAGVAISRAALLAEMRRGGKDARAALEDLIQAELLAAAAAPAVAGDPEVADARDRAAVQRMVERELEPKLTKQAIPDDVLQQVYDKARSVFVHPRLVEVAMLSVYTGGRMKDEPRAQARATARELEAYVRAKNPPTPDAFEAVASEPAWRERKVKHARLLQALEEPFAADVGRVVATLKGPGDTTPLIEAESGFHIARYVSERPAENITFEAARPRLRDQIFERWRQSAFLDFAQAAAGSHVIEAYPERL
jgi:parvulin-like peptidyl-prolyl cis-trans isomerase-like protein